MATYQVIGASCDFCKKLGLTEVRANHHHKLSIDGGPEKRMDLCDRCELDFGVLVAVYHDEAQEPPSQQQQERLAAKSKRATKVPAPEPEAPDPAEKARVICPLAAEHHEGTASLILYHSRGMHANKIHNCPPNQIAWEDPDGFLKFPCDEHEDCRKTGYSFPSKTAVVRHVASLKNRPGWN